MSILTLQNPLRSILWPSRTHAYLKETALILMGIFLLALSAQMVIPLQPVPLTFQSAMVVFLGMTYGSRRSCFSVVGYLLAGGLGLPVFAESSSGMHVFVGPTVGYLIGFVPAVLLGGFLAERGWARSIVGAFLASIISATVIFFFGVIVLSHFVGFYNAILLGLMPFILTEPLKLFAIALVIPRFWRVG